MGFIEGCLDSALSSCRPGVPMSLPNRTSRCSKRLLLAVMMAVPVSLATIVPATAQSQRVDLSAIDLSKLDLSGVDLSGIDLSGVDLSGLDTSRLDPSMLDPSQVVPVANDLLMRAPDRDVDALLDAVHTASQSERDAAQLCSLFESDADRSPAGLQRVAANLGEDSRQRFVNALTGIAMAGLQGQRQAYDPDLGLQTLKSAGIKAMLLNENFAAGMSGDGSDAASRNARCQSAPWVLDALRGFELPQRAAATRYLLSQGLGQYSNTLD